MTSHERCKRCGGTGKVQADLPGYYDPCPDPSHNAPKVNPAPPPAPVSPKVTEGPYVEKVSPMSLTTYLHGPGVARYEIPGFVGNAVEIANIAHAQGRQSRDAEIEVLNHDLKDLHDIYEMVADEAEFLRAQVAQMGKDVEAAKAVIADWKERGLDRVVNSVRVLEMALAALETKPETKKEN